MWRQRGRSACLRHRPNSATARRMWRRTSASCSRATTARVTTRTPGGWTRRCSKACSSGQSSSDVRGEPTVKLRPAVAEEAEGCAVLLGGREVQRRDQHARLLRPKLGEHVAALVADEAVTIETLAVF